MIDGLRREKEGMEEPDEVESDQAISHQLPTIN
jgi:hypothetical protein